jgi:hypothetical protein
MRRKVLALLIGIVCASAGLAGIPIVGGSSIASALTPAAPASSAPVGALDVATIRFGSPGPLDHLPAVFQLSGWAADRNAPGQPIEVDLQVNGLPVQPTFTGQPRGDVPHVLPWAGGSTGWSISVPALQVSGGTVCAYAINVPAGGPNTLIGCRDLSQPNPNDPIGSFDAAYATPGVVRLSGWAGDPDGYRTTHLRVSYETSPQPVVDTVADRPRPDVKAAFPRLSLTTGFDLTLPIPPGVHTVCIEAQNTGPDGYRNLDLGCVHGTVPDARPPGPHDPRGIFEGAGRVGLTNRWNARGWAYDPDTGGPVQVRVRSFAVNEGEPWPNNTTYISRLSTVSTGLPRADVQSLFPPAGPNSGFDGFAIAPRFAKVRLACAYAVNVGPGSSRLLGCYQDFN